MIWRPTEAFYPVSFPVSSSLFFTALLFSSGVFSLSFSFTSFASDSFCALFIFLVLARLFLNQTYYVTREMEKALRNFANSSGQARILRRLIRGKEDKPIVMKWLRENMPRWTQFKLASFERLRNWENFRIVQFIATALKSVLKWVKSQRWLCMEYL